MNILPSISDLPTGKNLVRGLGGEAFKMFRKPTQNKKDSSQKFMLLGVLLLALVCVIATEPLKVIFRKRIGEDALDIGGVIIGCSIYFGWGVLLFAIAMIGAPHSIPMPEVPYISYIFLTASAIYIALTFYIINASMNEKYRARAEESLDWNIINYRGDSILMEKYRRKGWSKEKIWYEAEPRAAFIVGLITSCFCLIGLPVLITSICFGINEWYHCKYLPNERKREIRRSQIEKISTNSIRDNENRFHVM